MTWRVTADMERFEEALQWFLSRNVITSTAAAALDDRAKSESFWVGAGLQLSQVQRVFDKIGRAIRDGVSYSEFKTSVADTLRRPEHTLTVFRNAVQRSYNAGRMQQMRDPDVQSLRPFGMFDSVHDSRQSPICKKIDPPGGPPTILPLDHPWWNNHTPPLHHRCRSGIRSLRRSEAERRGISETPPDASADGGFGILPGAAPPWKPSAEDHDAELMAELERKAAKSRQRKSSQKHEPQDWLKTYKQYGDAAPAVAWGRAAYERGLDARIADIRKRLEPLAESPGVARMLDSIKGLAPTDSLRTHAGELDGIRRAAASFAGHLERIKTARVTYVHQPSDERGRQALRFLDAVTDKSVQKPTSWRFVSQSDRAACLPRAKAIIYNPGIGVMEHELGHALETENSRLRRSAARFRAVRTSGEKFKRLDEIHPGFGYEPDELCKEDKFAAAYIGKFYGASDDTEITSMGLQSLAGGGSLASTEIGAMMARDPEHAWLTLGLLAGQ